jgi:hypothetical protein
MIRVIKSRRMRPAGHVVLEGQITSGYKFAVRRSGARETLGRHILSDYRFIDTESL